MRPIEGSADFAGGMRMVSMIHRVGAPLLLAAALTACGGGGSPTGPAPAPTPMPTPTPTPPTADGVLRTGTFQSANGYFTEGSASIVRMTGAHTLELAPDFLTSQSGALDMRLCRTTSCGAGDLDLGSIRSFSGAQTYALPDDGSAYAYAVVWCRAVALPFGYAELR